MFEGWNQVGDAAMGLLPNRVGAPVNDVLGEMRYAAAGLGYLEWVTYRDAAELHTQLVEPEMVTDVRMLDALTRCATRIATQLSISQISGEGLLHRAIALRDRLPQVLECLKLGLVSPRHIRTIVSRTELVDGEDYASEVGSAIAVSLRRKGSWSDSRMRDMVDRIVYRHDPDAVRERRRRALDDRGCWIERGEDGMAEVGASMSAENALLAYKNVCDLADRVCSSDGRTKAQRRSDASFTLQSGAAWECLCGDADCSVATTVESESDPEPDDVDQFTESTSDEPASGGSRSGGTQVPAPATPTPTKPRHCRAPTGPNRKQRRAAGSRAQLHAYTDPATANGTADHPGFLDGYGVISADHVRDLLTDPGVRMHVLGNRHNADGTVRPQPCTQPANPYRPSTALRTYVRARDEYCMWPGCNRAACDTDLDHTDEYDHDHPERGGQTSPTGLISLCRFHHLIKTFTTWITDQFIGSDGRMRFTITTPEGLTHDGPAHTGEDVIPGLADIEFEHPPDAPRPCGPDADAEATDEPSRRRTRLEEKLNRRRTERERNRARREDDATKRRRATDDDPPPPF